jgi:hypothetical protein
MKGHVALIREQGVNFAVVVVKWSAMRAPSSTKDDLVLAYSREFEAPTVLMAEDFNGGAEFYGRRDLVKWLENVDRDLLPWREFTIRAA